MPRLNLTPSGRSPIPSLGGDRTLQQEVESLHQLFVILRWSVVGAMWLFTLPISAWVLRRDLQLLRDTFTWTAVRYALAFKPGVAIALSLCIGLTLGVLLWQSRNILFGLPNREVKRLCKQVLHIRRQGHRHPFWRWVCKS